MWSELSSECGASCLGASFLWGELSWGELPLGQVVLIPLSLPLIELLKNVHIFAYYNKHGFIKKFPKQLKLSHKSVFSFLYSTLKAYELIVTLLYLITYSALEINSKAHLKCKPT